jgi:hypothetical protein
MEFALQQVGTMWYNRIRQFNIGGMEIRTLDKNNKPSFAQINELDLQEDYDFTREAGSTMPVNKSAMLDLMIRLSQTTAEDGLPMVDRNTVLAFTSVPEKKKIVERFAELSGTKKQQSDEDMMQQQAMQIAAQQMMAQQQHQQGMEVGSIKHAQGKDMAMLNAQAEQVRGVNSAVTDEQLQAVLEILRNNPELIQELAGNPAEQQSNPMGL